ncbi:hypothetical protein CEP51_012729 [Fusarium floridanum]|uniref:Uncharacterized protein n=1 Tax=Fusarium floridanum TaxID=1325733 RepID=A0A428QNP5_9HYPO|nr:hypothetical protein CEP51_012729 [Fusarium floridanum]
MRPNQRNVDLFFAIAQTFVASLPPAPDRDRALADDMMLALTNSVVNLRFEITRLLYTFSIDRALIELPERDCARANIALEDILDMLDNLVDESICMYQQDLGNSFPRLESLKRVIVLLNPAVGLDGFLQAPDEVLRYICYVAPKGHEAARHRRSANVARQFNDTMDQVFSSRMGIMEAGPTEVFHHDRNSEIQERDLDKSDLEEIHAAKRLSNAAKKIAQILTKSICQKPHSGYINLTGFPEAEIFTIMTVCHSENRWRAVQWTSTNRHDTKTTTNQASSVAICEEVKRRHRPKSILHIEVYPDGSWRTQKMPPNVLTTYSRPPKATLEELIIPEQAQEEGTKLGSPFLQDAWSSGTMRCSGGDIFAPGTFHEDVQHHITDNKAFILSLGVLLWELFFQQKVCITEEDEESDDADLSLFNALNREAETWREKFVDAACLDIILNCLDAWCEDEADEDKLRASIHRNVFRPLREYWASYSHPRPKDTAKATGPRFLHRRSPAFMSSSVPASGMDLVRAVQIENIRSQALLELRKGHVQLPVISESAECVQEATLLAAGNGTTADSLAWINKFQHANKHLASLNKDTRSKPVKIAILDTGLDTDDPYFSGAGIDRVDDWDGLWHDCLGESSTPVDDDKGRHGTALTCLLLQLAPEAIVYVVRVAKSSSGLGQAQHAIAAAILHVVTSWDVDVISMSFGFSEEIELIRDAIVQAEILKRNKILFFAAANNDGLNEPEMFPAFFESVISARGTECDGEFIQRYNPKSWSHKSGIQYGTLARDVPYNWPTRNPTKSGCSVSTPILAAIAAILISFVDSQRNWDAERHAIRTRRGMVAVFNVMAQDDSARGRLYVAPWQLYEQRREPQSLVKHALCTIP